MLMFIHKLHNTYINFDYDTYYTLKLLFYNRKIIINSTSYKLF